MIRNVIASLLLACSVLVLTGGVLTRLCSTSASIWPSPAMDIIAWPLSAGQTSAFVEAGSLAIMHVSSGGSCSQEIRGFDLRFVARSSFPLEPPDTPDPLRAEVWTAPLPVLSVALLAPAVALIHRRGGRNKTAAAAGPGRASHRSIATI